MRLPLARELFGEDVEVRKRAADVARRITEADGTLLEPYADELAGLLETLRVEESRTRWHPVLVVPRVAHTRMQRLKAARTMSLLAEDESNVVRCSAVEVSGCLLRAGEDYQHLQTWDNSNSNIWVISLSPVLKEATSSQSKL
jgi:hypothetical protein